MKLTANVTAADRRAIGAKTKDSHLTTRPLLLGVAPSAAKRLVKRDEIPVERPIALRELIARGEYCSLRGEHRREIDQSRLVLAECHAVRTLRFGERVGQRAMLRLLVAVSRERVLDVGKRAEHRLAISEQRLLRLLLVDANVGAYLPAGEDGPRDRRRGAVLPARKIEQV